MARTSIATDNFNRASLGADWGQLHPYNGNVTIYNSTNVYSAQGYPVGNWPAARWVGAGTFTDDQYSSLVISALGFIGTDYGHSVIVRASADQDGARDYYGAAILNNAGGPNYTTVLYKVVNGTITTLHSATNAWAVNDRLELEVEGSTLRVCKNGTALGGSFTQTDTSLTTGKPGVAMAAGGSSSILGDDWEGGNITGTVALEGAATGGATASGTLQGDVPLAGAATGGATASAALTVTPSRSFQFTLYAVDGATPLASKTGLWWAWWPSLAAVRSAAPDAQGTGASTDGSGVFSVVAPSALSAGANQGFGIISDQDATPDATEAAYVGSFDVV